MFEISDLHASYGGINAVRGVSFKVAAGGMVAIVGPNGAGKTSLLNAASGFVQTLRGRILLEGEDLTGRAPHVIAQMGLIQVPEGRQILGPLTVQDNLDLGRNARSGRSGDGQLDLVFTLFPTLRERRQQIAGSLSGGQQQMLAIGRALMGNPKVLLLDEPSLGLAPKVTGEVFDTLVRLNHSGLTIVLVEQNARRALACTQYAYVMERGKIVHQGDSLAIADDPAVLAHYLGSTTANT